MPSMQLARRRLQKRSGRFLAAAQSRSSDTFTITRDTQTNSIDVLMCDEAHRIRETSNNRFTPTTNKSKRPQIEELLDAARTTVFFIDDQQVVRPGETGSTNYIKENALRLGCELSQFELEVQFRCAGSEGFVNWIDNTLAIRPTANVLWTGEEQFDFRILEQRRGA